MSKKLWLYQWIDNHEVWSLKDAAKILKNEAPRRELHELVSVSGTDPEEISGRSALTIVAGRAIDLSGELDCCSDWDVLRKQVDRLFSQVWHYFDRIVVVGPDANELSKMWSPESEPRVLERILTYIRLLLYLREIGAEDLLVFITKPHVCEFHLDQDLKRLGMRPALDVADKAIEGLTGTAEIETKPHEDHLHYTFNHPDFEHTVWGTVDRISKGSHMTLRQSVATAVYKRYLAHLASDIWTANYLKSPLGATVKLHQQMLETLEVGAGEGDVAFHLKLPFLRGVAAKDLLKIRRDEKIHFDRFRQSLRTAIFERIGNSSSRTPELIAAEIERDLIEPSLNRIEGRLVAAKKVLAKKAGLTISIGAFATTCGLLTGNPLLVTTGVTTAVGGALSAEYKFIEEQSDVSLSDMYFLWQAVRHTSTHAHT